MAKEFIVALELGSSKITGIAGKKNSDGSITVLAVVREHSSGCIRKGMVYNIDKTSQCLTNIMSKLKTQLKSEIARVYIGVGGQGIRSVRNVIVKELSPETIVTQEMVDGLMDTNRNMPYPDHEIIDAATQEFKVGAQMQLEPVGIPTSHLEGNFLNVIGKKSLYRSLNKCFDNAGIAIAERYLSPSILAEAVLTEAERRSGCLLVDLGADTTTVVVYHRDILRHLSVIPLGGNNITKDLESLQMDENEAERMKLKYGSAYTDNADIDAAKRLPIDDERSIDSPSFVKCVEARVEEIVRNVWNQVPIEYSEKLIGGIVLTGGGSNMPNIETVFKQTTGIEKVRLAKFVTASINPANTKIDLPHDGTMCTAIAILMKGNMDSAGKELADQLFPGGPRPSTAGGQTGAKTPEETANGGKQADKDGENAANGNNDSQKEQDAKKEQTVEDSNTARQHGLFGKFRKTVKDFMKTIASPDPEE